MPRPDYPEREMPIPGRATRSAFIRGVARLVDLSGSLSSRRAPRRNAWGVLAEDGARIAGDLWKAVERASDETGVTPADAEAKGSRRHSPRIENSALGE